jgi:hypothetical protein
MYCRFTRSNNELMPVTDMKPAEQLTLTLESGQTDTRGVVGNGLSQRRQRGSAWHRPLAFLGGAERQRQLRLGRCQTLVAWKRPNGMQSSDSYRSGHDKPERRSASAFTAERGSSHGKTDQRTIRKQPRSLTQ